MSDPTAEEAWEALRNVLAYPHQFHREAPPVARVVLAALLADHGAADAEVSRLRTAPDPGPEAEAWKRGAAWDAAYRAFTNQRSIRDIVDSAINAYVAAALNQEEAPT